MSESDSKIRAELDGLQVTLFRNTEDGTLTIAVDTHDLKGKDTYAPGCEDMPKIGLLVNECYEQLDREGQWVREDYPPRKPPEKKQTYSVSVSATYIGSVDIDATSFSEAEALVTRGILDGTITPDMELSDYDEVSNAELLENQ